jgi:hypothetical protein
MGGRGEQYIKVEAHLLNGQHRAFVPHLDRGRVWNRQ